MEAGNAKGRPPTQDQLEFMAAEPSRDDAQVMWMCNAYARLATTRQLGFGCVGPVQVDIIEEWCDRRWLDDDATEMVVAVIMSVDAVTMSRQRQRIK